MYEPRVLLDRPNAPSLSLRQCQLASQLPLPRVPVSGNATFSVPERRSLPVILLADTSGSMEQDGKIDVMNRAIAEMVDALANDVDAPAQLLLMVITFGGTEASLHVPLGPVEGIQWSPMSARGRTPLGGALALLNQLIGDDSVIRRNSYHPTLVLLSDGQPTDAWEEPLRLLIESERGRKAVRLAVAIGADADIDVLRAFVSDQTFGVLRADQARQIHTFFRWLTATLTSRSRAPQPNQAAVLPPPSLDEIDF